MTALSDQEKIAALTESAIEYLRQVYDPEIPVNIYDLGLVYRIDIVRVPEEDAHDLTVDMTLTTVNCPLADMIPGMVYDKLAEPGLFRNIKINMVWEPPWDKSMMSDEARLMLDMF